MSMHSGPEQVLLSQGTKASPGPRSPEQKSSGSSATTHSCPIRSSSCPLNVLISQASSQTLALTWQVPWLQ